MGIDHYDVAPVDLVHVLEPAGADSRRRLQDSPPPQHSRRIITDVQGQISGGSVSESHPRAGEDFTSPQKQSEHLHRNRRGRSATGTSLQEIGDIQVIGLSAGQVRLHHGGEVDIET